LGHQLHAVDLGVGIRRIDRQDHFDVALGIAPAEAFHDVERRIVRSVGGKQDFVIRIVLAEEGLQILFQISFQPGNRFEQSDAKRRFHAVFHGSLLPAKAPGKEHTQQAVPQTTRP